MLKIFKSKISNLKSNIIMIQVNQLSKQYNGTTVLNINNL